MSDTKINLIINEFETRQQAEDNIDALGEKELIFTKDKVLPNPTQNDNGKAVIVEDGDFALGDVAIDVDQEYDPTSENPQSGIAISEPIEGLSDSIDAINEKIPNIASSSNQLADKAFVNSTVQTATANFRGNWSTWQNVPTNDQLYPVDYLGIKTPSTNDYMTVGDASDYPDQVLSGVWRFKYSGVWATSNKSGWRPEYKVNDEPMTQAQLNALNSGITGGRVDAYDEHIGQTDNPHNVTKSQVGLGNVNNTSDLDKPISTATQTALNDKQATLVSGTNIKTVGGVSLLGSGNIPTGDSVSVSDTGTATDTASFITVNNIEKKIKDKDAQRKNIEIKNIFINSTDWVPIIGVEGYDYLTQVVIPNITWYDTAIVIFQSVDADSGSFASVCHTYDGGITLYAKQPQSVLIPLIIIIKSSLEPLPTPETPTLEGTILTIQDVPGAEEYSIIATDTQTLEEYGLGTISANELGGQ